MPSARRAAIATGLVIARDGGYTFRHALERQAVYARVVPEDRVRLHELVALALSEACAGSPVDATTAARIASHWAQTPRRDRYAAAVLEAGVAAASIGAYAEARDQLVAGLRWYQLWRSQWRCPWMPGLCSRP